MTDRLDIVFLHAADLELDVDWEDLGDYRRGEYRRRERRIVLNRRLTHAQAASTGIHEIGHAVFNDGCSIPWRESRAWEYGAGLLVEVEEYALAEEIVGCHPNSLGIELGVTPRLVLSWRRWYLRRFPVEMRRSPDPAP